jgi:uncharacterized 44.6 kDa protein in cps region
VKILGGFEGKAVLMVNCDFVYPPDHGDRVDSWNRIKCLRQMGCIVDLICTVKESPKQEYVDEVKKYVRKLFLCMRKNRVIDIFSPLPLQLKSRERLKDVKLDGRYDYLIVDDTAAMLILQNATLSYDKAMLHMNNDNHVYFKGLASSESILWKKLYYLLDAFKYKRIDASVVRALPNIAFVSYDEMLRYRRAYPEIHATFLPVAIETEYKERALDSKTVLLIGSLFMINNQDAIRFYLQEVHPHLTRDVEGYRLIIAGNSRKKGVAWIEELIATYDNVDIYDTPEDLDGLYEQSSVFVNPMRYGAGVKLKTVNAIVNGLPVVATTIGNEGTGLVSGEQILVDDNPMALCRYIKELLGDASMRRRFVDSAQKYLRENYNQKEKLSAYLSSL